MRIAPSSRRLPRARTILLRLAVNATLAGWAASVLLVLLVFYLNSGVSLTARNYFPLAFPILLFYGPISGLVLTALAGVIRLFAAFRVSTPWIGFRPFWRFLVADLWLLSLLYAYNLSEARDYLPVAMIRHLQGATFLLAGGCVLFVGGTLWSSLRRRRLRPLMAILGALLVSGTLFSIRERYREETPPVSASEIEPPQPRNGLLLLGIEGAAPEDVLPMVADGRLPNFGSLLRAGSTIPLIGRQPPRLLGAWASVLTGRAPSSHGLVEGRGFSPLGSQAVFRTPPLGIGFDWLTRIGLVRLRQMRVSLDGQGVGQILQRCGYEVMAAGWGGMMDGDLVPAGQVPQERETPLPVSVTSYRDLLRRHLETARQDGDGTPLERALASALHDDMTSAAALWRATRRVAAKPRALFLRLAGLENVVRVFLRYQRPHRFGNVSDEELERYSQVIPDYYRFLDAWLGLLAEAAGPSARVFVVSPYGVAPVGVFRRLRNAVAGTWHDSGTHRHAGPGLLLAAGPGVRVGGRLEGARLEDVLPTLLYVLDLPVGRDMQGQTLPGLASDEFARTHAVSAIPSWKTVRVVPHAALW
ncbi:MAG: alkaline phosphatase family protein [Acidobacteriota bacterium]